MEKQLDDRSGIKDTAELQVRLTAIRCDVLCVHISHRRFQMLEPFGNLQNFWTVVNVDDPAAIINEGQHVRTPIINAG